MRLSAVFARAAVAAALSLPFAGEALAQSSTAPPMGGGGGGGRGGGGFEIYDPCQFGDCFRRPRPRPYRPRPGVVIIEEDPVPYIYEEDLGPAEPRRPAKPKKQQAKPKPKKTDGGGSGGGGLVAGTNYRPDEVIVEFPLTTPQSEIDAIAQRERIEQLGSQEIALLNTRIHRWRITDGRTPQAVASAIRGSGGVASTNLNQVFVLQQTAASAGPPQYAPEKLKFADIHTRTQGDGILIALIDSGADGNHPELSGAVSETFDAIGGEFAPHAHGTGMAGAIAAHAQLKGAAPKARILNVRAFAPNGKTEDGTTFDVVRGIDWAAQKGARVLNLSFAGARDPLLSRVIKAAIEKKIVVIAAAGNAGPKSPPLYPAAESGVIAVTATDDKDGVMAMANRGGYVTIAAPGVDILLPAPNGAYNVSTGTSIATAYVSGIAALMIASNPEADNKEVYEVLVGTARDLGAKGRDKDFGAGLTDPLAALTAMEPIPQTVSVPAGETPVR